MHEVTQAVPMRRAIVIALVVCLAVAMAPWFSGGQEPVGMLVSAGALLLGSLLAWRQPGVRKLQFGPLMISYGILIGFALLSLAWTASKYSTVLWVTQWAMVGLTFRLAYTVAGEREGREWVLRAYFVTAALFCVAALWMFFSGDYDRLTGWFYWANPAAAYLIPAVVVGWDKLLKARGAVSYLWMGAGALFLCSFLLTDSRAATIVLALVGGIYLFVARTSKVFWIRFVFMVALGFGLSLGAAKLSIIVAHHTASAVPGSRFAEAVSGESQSGSDRLTYLESAGDMWFARPLGGYGAGTFGDVHPQYQKRVVSASTSAHNVYVQTLAELGLVGAVALAAVLLWLLAGVLRGLVAVPDMVPVALGVLGLLLHMGLDLDARYPALLVLAAVLAGLVYRQAGQGWARASWRWPAVAALVLVPAVSLYQSDGWAVRGAAAQQDGDLPQAAALYGNAHSGLVYDPDLLSAEGVNLYAVATGGGPDAHTAAALALERARQAEAQDPHDGQQWQLEGRVLALQGDNAAAEKAFRHALQLDGFNHPDYALDLASLQVRAGNVAGGLQTAGAMLAQYPDNVVVNRSNDATVRPALGNLEALIGNVYLQEGRISDAGVAARRALKLDTNNLRGRALMHQVDKAVSQTPPAPTPVPQSQ